MPIHLLAAAFTDGPQVIPGWEHIKIYGPLAFSLFCLKYYFAGARNTWEKPLNGQVYIVTGGTAGLGSSIVAEIARKGAQVVLLVRNLNDGWVIDSIDAMRDKYDNQMIYAEECDLNSLHSVRKFCTKWLDNQTPRRLDGVILCAGECIPIGKPRELSEDGVEKQIAINYLSYFHLLNLLAPSIRSQPADRFVKIIVSNCLSYVFGKIDLDDVLWEERSYPLNKPWKVYGTAKLSLCCFIKEFQRRLDSYVRSDKSPMTVKCYIINPGFMRSPSTKRALSFGSIFGLFMYVLFYPILWLFLKSTYQGAQSYLFALQNEELRVNEGGIFIEECSIIKNKPKKELNDLEFQKKLYDRTESLIKDLEKNSAIERKKKELRKEKESKKNKKKAKGKNQNDDEKQCSSEQELKDKRKSEEKLSFIKKNKQLIEKEFERVSKEPLMFGDFSGSKIMSKDNKYLKDLDAKYDAMIARKKSNPNEENQVMTTQLQVNK